MTAYLLHLAQAELVGNEQTAIKINLQNTMHYGTNHRRHHRLERVAAPPPSNRQSTTQFNSLSVSTTSAHSSQRVSPKHATLASKLLKTKHFVVLKSRYKKRRTLVDVEIVGWRRRIVRQLVGRRMLISLRCKRTMHFNRSNHRKSAVVRRRLLVQALRPREFPHTHWPVVVCCSH
jgi:hypothetical protein